MPVVFEGAREDPEAIDVSRTLDVLEALQDAREACDYQTYYALLPQLQIPAGTLMGMKNTPDLGADFIRELRLDTSLADARYGPGWLDRDGWE